MFEIEVTPRFCETDALGHINNTVFAVWCEAARDPIFKIFNPELNLKKWNLIVAHLDVSMLSPCYFEFPVTIQTHVSKIGRTSFDVTHQIFQNDQKVASVVAVLVHYDYELKTSIEISKSLRSQLQSLEIY